MNNKPAAPMAFADNELDWLIQQARKDTEGRYVSAYINQAGEIMASNLHVFITRGMIAHALTSGAGMDDTLAWEFSKDLDMSIEDEYLPEGNLSKRYDLIMRDMRQYVEMDKCGHGTALYLRCTRWANGIARRAPAPRTWRRACSVVV